MKHPILILTMLIAAAFVGGSCSENNKDTDKRYQVGDLYLEGDVKGMVYTISDAGKHGMIVTLDQTQVKWAVDDLAAKASSQAVDEQDGQKNRAVILALADWRTKYPAFAWCDAKNANGVSGWFLPAYSQLNKLYKVYIADKAAFNAAMVRHGGTEMNFSSPAGSDFWSSTSDVESSLYAVTVEFYEGKDDFPNKTEENWVRAVRAF